jgi:lipoate-protein ligase A
VGFHQSADVELDPDFLRRHGLTVVRRAEGGGTVYLDPDQLFYQFVYAGTSESSGGPSDFARYLAVPIEAARNLGLNAELRPPSDIVVNGRKISGNAGGEWDGAHIISGDILGRSDVRAMAEVLRLPHPALRPLVKREIARRLTSWEVETGQPPDWGPVKKGIIEGVSKCEIGRPESGTPSEAEEATFRSETVSRHQDPSWREPPTPSPLPGQPRRKIRVAGPHGILVFDEPTGRGFLVAVADGSRLVDGYCLDPGPEAELEPLREGASQRVELARQLRGDGGFE